MQVLDRMGTQDIVDGDTFVEQIRNRYALLNGGLCVEDEGRTIYTNSSHGLSEGCRACKAGTWICLPTTGWCNLTCDFCARKPPKKDHDEHLYINTRSAVQVVSDIMAENPKITGVSFSGGEFLLERDKVISILTLFSKTAPAIYLWAYTNGKLVDSDILAKLKDAGLDELRVNLAATDFSDEVLEKLILVKDIIGKVTVEIPSIPQVRKRLLDDGKLQILIDCGVAQLNLAELMIHHQGTEGYVVGKEAYVYKSWLVSPTESRFITVDIIEYVVRNGLDILVNDCSNDAKYLHLIRKRYGAKYRHGNN